MKTILTPFVFVLTLTAGIISTAWAAPYEFGDDKPTTLFEQFRHQQLLEVTLVMDIASMLENKRTNDFLPAKFSFRNSIGDMVDWDIEVRVRGRFRRRACEFPPLKLKFPKKEMKAEGIGKHNDVKLVTHCMDNKKGEEALFREYLTYQLYARLTDVSFRTQLIQITYVDSRTGAENKAYGILIEDSDELAERLNTEECEECFGLTTADFDRSNLQIHDMFQYMIGNTDWTVSMSRNMKILTPKSGEGKLLAPYDFDFAGLVNAPYAVLNADLQQENLRDRFYLGGKWSPAEWSVTMDLFKKKRSELMDTVDRFEFLNNKGKKDIKEYLNSFYELLDQNFTPQNAYNAR